MPGLLVDISSLSCLSVSTWIRACYHCMTGQSLGHPDANIPEADISNKFDLLGCLTILRHKLGSSYKIIDSLYPVNLLSPPHLSKQHQHNEWLRPLSWEGSLSLLFHTLILRINRSGHPYFQIQPNPTTSHHLHCCHSILSPIAASRRLQQPLNWYPCCHCCLPGCSPFSEQHTES